ncbi:unnamed protein product, partial [Symbiodinium natans]
CWQDTMLDYVPLVLRPVAYRCLQCLLHQEVILACGSPQPWRSHGIFLQRRAKTCKKEVQEAPRSLNFDAMPRFSQSGVVEEKKQVHGCRLECPWYWPSSSSEPDTLTASLRPVANTVTARMQNSCANPVMGMGALHPAWVYLQAVSYQHTTFNGACGQREWLTTNYDDHCGIVEKC